MYITKLETENWRRIPRLSIDLARGINLIYGRNEIGKSSIIESIRMALLQDASAKSREFKNFVTWGTDIPATVRLFFTSHDSRQYEIRKTFPGGGASLFLGGHPLCKDAKKTQAQIFEILGIPERAAPLFDLLFIDQGQTLSIFEKKGNPLTEDTRAYIGTIIKETAFRELRAFEQALKKEQEEILTTRGVFKSGREAPECKRLLDEALILKKKLDELAGKESACLTLLEEIETLDREIGALDKAKAQKENLLKGLREKRIRLEEIEKKGLAFAPLRKGYEQLLRIDDDLERAREDLSKLFLARESLIFLLHQEIEEGDAERLRLSALIGKLKVKKGACEQLLEKRRGFGGIEGEYRKLLDLRERMGKTEKLLPRLLSLNRQRLRAELQEIEARIGLCRKKQDELAKLGERIKTYPEIKEKEIRELKERAKRAGALENKIESHRSSLAMRFAVTPCNAKEIRFRVERDQGGEESYVTDKPLEITGFQSLSFHYPGEFDLRVSGSLANIDIERVQGDLEKEREEIQERLSRFGCPSLDEAEKRYQELRDLARDQEGLRKQVDALEAIPVLEGRRSEVADQIRMVEKEMEGYPDTASAPEGMDAASELTGNISCQRLRDDLIRVKAERENLGLQMEGILGGRTFEEKEKGYLDAKGEIEKLAQEIERIEPVEIKEVTQKELDLYTERLNALIRTLDQKRNGHDILTHIELLAESGTGAEAGQKLNSDLRVDTMPAPDTMHVADTGSVVETGHGAETKLAGDAGPSPGTGIIADIKLVPDIKPNADAGLNLYIKGMRKKTTKVDLSPQEIRDRIRENDARQSELSKQKGETLSGKGIEDYKRAYLLARDEIGLLAKTCAEMPPEGLNTLKDIEVEITRAEGDLKSMNRNREEKSGRKAGIAGELKNLGPILEEKEKTAYEYCQIKERIKAELTVIAGLKLLVRLMAEEKEKGEKEVFRPIQERVIQTFSSLIPDSYSLEIDNELHVGISARTRAGSLQQGVYPSLSYGTREQLSFLVRLAIAEQLSRKESQVMILDDSFVNTDHRRLPQILDIITERSRDIQFLLFTCREDDYRRYRDDFHCINLEEVI